MVQSVTKDSSDFPVPQQLIIGQDRSSYKRNDTGKNRALPFYPDPIYRSPPRPPENL